MGTVVLGLFSVLWVVMMVKRDSKKKGIPVLEYIAALLVVIAIAVGGSILTGLALGRAGANTAKQIAAFGIMIVTIVLCIWVCYRLFLRLSKKYPTSK